VAAVRRRWAGRLAWAAAALLLLLALRLYPPLRHPLDAALLAQALFAGEERSWLARWTSPPERLEAGEVDLYRPAAGDAPPRGCVLLAHGMTDLGRRDPRLAAFARALARLGFAVAAPELPGMRRFRPDPEDVDRIAAGFAWLEGQYAASGLRCGLLAFSFAAGPALMAAARPGAASRAACLIAVGAYHDLRAVLRHLTTGGREDEPAFPGGPPVRVGKWLFLRYNAELLGLEGHREEAEAIVRLKLADERAEIAPLVERLPERLRPLLALIENKDPSRFDALYAAQPPELRARLEGWSMEEVVGRTRLPIFLLHGRGDPFVPPSESLRLAERARERPGAGVRLLVLDVLGHVDPGEKALSLGGALEAVRLLGFVSEALTAMEGSSGPSWRVRLSRSGGWLPAGAV